MEQRENRRKRTADNVNGGFRHLRWDTRGRFLHGKLRKLRIAKRRAKKRDERRNEGKREKDGGRWKIDIGRAGKELDPVV